MNWAKIDRALTRIEQAGWTALDKTVRWLDDPVSQRRFWYIIGVFATTTIIAWITLTVVA